MNPTNGRKTELECEEHAGVAARGRCVVCARPVCRECSREEAAGLVCALDDHGTFLLRWALIHQSCSEFEAEVVSGNLACQGVETKTFSSRRFKNTLHDAPDELVKVFVRQEVRDRAQEILRSLDLTGRLE